MADLATIRAALGAGHEGPVWLLDLDVGGRVYRIADVQAEVDGHLYQAGLSPISVSHAGDLLDELAVELAIGEDWASLIEADAVRLDLARATLRRWWPGQGLHDGEVVIDGEVVEPEWGSADEPLTITIAREARTGTLLEPQAVVDETTWPPGHAQGGDTDFALSPSVEGQYYPLILGYPGLSRLSVGMVTGPASPGLLASVKWGVGDPPAPTDSSLVVIAGHRVAASSVRVTVVGADRISSESRPVQHVQDALGRTVAAVDFVNSSLPAFGEAPEIWVGWHTSTGGGLVGPDGSVVRGAGQVIEWVLRHRTRLRVDWGRMAVELPELDAYLVDGWYQGQVDAWEWLEKELFRLLPVVVLESDRGLYLRRVRWSATRADATAHLDADLHQVDRTSRLVALRQPIENEFELMYRQLQGERWGTRRWVSAAPGRRVGGVADVRVDYHPRCAASLARYGHRPRLEPIQAAWVYDVGTAARILADLADRYALPLRTVRYAGGWDLDDIEAWDVVTVTDSEVALEERVALVSQRTVDADGVTLDLILLPR